MDFATIIGVVVGTVAVLMGMIFKGVPPGELLNPAAILIIIFGTVGAVMIAFPLSELKRVPKLFGVLFKEKKNQTDAEIIRLFSDLADSARREGLLSLESRTADLDDPFLKNGLSLAVDGQSAEYIRDVLTEEIEAMEDRHAGGALIFTQAGTYAPTLGVLGAVVGLIAALSDMNDIDKLGHAISGAFIATMLGIFTGYVLWHPFANKLKRKSKQETRQKMMVVEGVLSILEGEAPRVIEQKLASYLPAGERLKIFEEREEGFDGQETQKAPS